MPEKYSDIKKIIGSLIFEERQSDETEREIQELLLKVAVNRKENISDVLTDIRILKGVAVVTQTQPAKHVRGGNTILYLKVRYVPYGSRNLSIEELGPEMKKIRSIRIVRFLTQDGIAANKVAPKTVY